MRKMRQTRTFSTVWLLVIYFACVSSAFAQENLQINGKVIDSSDKGPMIGVNITVPGSTLGTMSNLDGNFSISVPANAVLRFSYIGYDDFEITAEEASKIITFQLTAKSTTLDDIVVVGYGTQKKTSTVASITQTDGADIMQSGNINTVSEALQGKLNGVIAINSTGQPGANSASIYIRGKSSWQNTDPLVLVDGIERDMNDVDFNEIETISVLKDASATAVYGVRGANGVILLTTKRGKEEKPTVTFSGNWGFKAPTTNLDWADYVTSMKMYNEASANDGQWGNIIPESEISAWENAFNTGNYGPYNDYFPDVNWYEEMVKTGVSQNYNVNINGQSDFMKYFVSVGYQRDGSIYKVDKQENFDPRSWYERLNWRANFDFNLTSSTTLSVNVAGKMGIRNQHFYTNLYRKIIQAPSNTFPIKYSDGYWGDALNQGANPIANLSMGGQENYKIFQGWYDAKLVQKLDFITEGLQARASISYNSTARTRNRILNSGVFGGPDANLLIQYPREYRTYDYTSPIYGEDGSLTYPLIENLSGFHGNRYYDLPVGVEFDRLEQSGRRLYYEFAIQYDRSFKGHNVGVLALMNRQIIDDGDGDPVSKMAFPSYTEDWVGRVTYNWKERYLMEFNISYTGSEKFAPGKRFGLFPSMSVGWRLTEEPFMQSIKNVLSNFKVRYSIGKVGSDRGAARFQYIQLYNQMAGIKFGKDQDVTFAPTYSEGKIAEPNATWETAVKQNLGLEIGLWNKLRITMDLFDEQRQGILLAPRTTAAWVGATIASSNLGRTKNHGIDLEIGWQDKIGISFNYFVNFNFSTSENRIVFKDDPKNMMDYEADRGKPIGYNKKYIVSGNFHSIDDIFNYAQSDLDIASNIIPGDFAYIDFNADGVINDKDYVVTEHLTYPLTTFSLALGFDWKGFSFSALFYSPQGVYKNGFNAFAWDFPASNIKGQPNVEDRWTPAKASGEGFQRPAIHVKQKHNDQDNTYRFTNYSYIRLKNLEISYRFPKKLLSHVKMSNLTVFVSGNNLFTICRGDKRSDPETGTENNYPIVRTYTTGLRFSF